jgi:hypothetical protein
MSPLTVQQRSGNNVYAQCADVFRAILTTSGEAVLPVRYELKLKYYSGEFLTAHPVRNADSMRRNRKTMKKKKKKKTDLQFI